MPFLKKKTVSKNWFDFHYYDHAYYSITVYQLFQCPFDYLPKKEFEILRALHDHFAKLLDPKKLKPNQQVN